MKRAGKYTSQAFSSVLETVHYNIIKRTGNCTSQGFSSVLKTVHCKNKIKPTEKYLTVVLEIENSK